jgi:hypothetical protein
VRNGSELMHDGPYLQVVLPGVLPPDWDTLRRDVESAIDDGATRVTVIASDRVGSETDDGRLEAMVDSLKSEGVEVVVFRQGEPSFGDVFLSRRPSASVGDDHLRSSTRECAATTAEVPEQRSHVLYIGGPSCPPTGTERATLLPSWGVARSKEKRT